MEISGNGNWTIEFDRPLDPGNATSLPYTFTGNGREVLPLIRWADSNVTVDVTYDEKKDSFFYVKFVANDPDHPGYFYVRNGYNGLDNLYYANGTTSSIVPFGKHVEIGPQPYDYVYLFVRTGDPASRWKISIT
jgi:hypothetical protein